MFRRIQNRLAFNVTLSVFIWSALLILLASLFSYLQTYETEISKEMLRIDQLVSTVENSAAIAAYLENNELALDVVKGLEKNDIVEVASISAESGFVGQSGETSYNPLPSSLSYPLSSPFMEGEITGKLIVVPNQQLIESMAQQTAITQSILLILYACFIVCLVAFLVHRKLTLPLIRLQNSVDSAQPGIDKLLTYKPKKTEDEIGRLVTKSNYLLSSIYETLERERDLRKKIEKVERRFRLLFEQATVGIALMTTSGKVALFNQSFIELVATNNSNKVELSGDISFAHLFNESEAMAEAIEHVCQNKKVTSGDFELDSSEPDNSRWLQVLLSPAIEESEEQLIEVVLYDISERRRRESKYRREAEYDTLTALFNRRAGERYISQLLNEAQSPEQQRAFVLVDLDHFKQVNDIYGHDAGDLVLVETAKRLKTSLRGGDLVCRWGGDEFVIVLRQGHGSLQVEPVMRALIENIIRPMDIGEQEPISLGASLGVSLTSEIGLDRDLLLKKADEAMYLVKQNGRNGYCISGEEPVFLP